MVILVSLHMLRTYYYGAYKRPRVPWLLRRLQQSRLRPSTGRGMSS